MKRFGTVAASPRPRVVPLLLAALLLAAPALAGSPTTGDARRGKARYEALCVICHGAGGKGDGPTARSLTPRPVENAAVTRPKRPHQPVRYRPARNSPVGPPPGCVSLQARYDTDTTACRKGRYPDLDPLHDPFEERWRGP